MLCDTKVDELKAAHRYAEIQALKIIRDRRLQLFKDRANQLMPDSEAAGLQILLSDAIAGLLAEKEKAGEVAAITEIQKLWSRESFQLHLPASERIARARALADKIRAHSNPLLRTRAA